MRPLRRSFPLALAAFVACGCFADLKTSESVNAASSPSTIPTSPSRAERKALDRVAAAHANNDGVDLAHQDKDEEASVAFETACFNGSWEGCLNLNTMCVFRKRVVPVEATHAEAVFTKAAELGDPKFAVNIGSLFKDGCAVRQDWARAAALFTKACDVGSTDGCYELGVMYLYGLGGAAKDEARAAALFEKACTHPIDKACVALKLLRETTP